MDVRVAEAPPDAPPRAPARPDARPSGLTTGRVPVVAVAVTILAAVAFAQAFLVSRTVFPSYSGDDDEAVYVFQSEMLLQGKITLPAEQQETFFRPWLMLRHGDRLVSVYQPVWPAVLAVSDFLFHTRRVALGATAAATAVLLFLFTLELLGDARSALAAAALLVASPFFLLQSGTMLSYVFALGLDLAFGLFALRAFRSGAWRPAAAAGFFWSILAFARPLDAIICGVTAAVCALAADRWRPRRLFRISATSALAAVPVLVLGAAYNTRLTGRPWTFPLQSPGTGNTFGFGKKFIAPGTPVYEFRSGAAVHAMLLNLGAIPHWVFGGLLLLPVLAYGAYALRRRGFVLAFLGATIAAWPAANLIYWGNVLIVRGRNMLGPNYYLPLLVPIAILGGVGVVAVLQTGRRRPAPVAGALVALLAVTGMELRPRLAWNLKVAADHDRDLAALDAAHVDGGVVIIPASPDGPWILHPRPALGNAPDLGGPVVYAADRGAANLRLTDLFPGRPLYRLTSLPPLPERPRRSRPWVHRLTHLSGERLALRFRWVNTTGAPVVTAYVNDGAHVAAYLLDDRSELGRVYGGVWTIGPEGARLDAPGARPLLSHAHPLPATTILGIGVGCGRASSFEALDRVEERLVARTAPQGVEVLAHDERWRRSGTPGATWTLQDPSPDFQVDPVT